MADLPKRRPVYADHVEDLLPYLAALENPALPQASFEWVATDAAKITVELRPEHVLSVQMSWHPGWTARVNGERRRTWGDPLGQMVVEPRCDGGCTVDLSYDGGAEMRTAQVLSWVAIAAGFAALAAVRYRRSG
jgi:hypothetical protein